VSYHAQGRYLFLNALANQLRYPNSHTHYFSCVLLFLFAEAQQEIIQVNDDTLFVALSNDVCSLQQVMPRGPASGEDTGLQTGCCHDDASDSVTGHS